VAKEPTSRTSSSSYKAPVGGNPDDDARAGYDADAGEKGQKLVFL